MTPPGSSSTPPPMDLGDEPGLFYAPQADALLVKLYGVEHVTGEVLHQPWVRADGRQIDFYLRLGDGRLLSMIVRTASRQIPPAMLRNGAKTVFTIELHEDGRAWIPLFPEALRVAAKVHETTVPNGPTVGILFARSDRIVGFQIHDALNVLYPEILPAE